MKVYVLTFGHASYEDNVVVSGVFRTEEEATIEGTKETPYHYQTAKFGQYWYKVEEFNLE